ncbi:cysteine synthase A [Treponema sp. Marseille-Q4130]|uniref:cysteine synthase A n=1 Tax=Treponema sp. Marseille-Q4130 TaxID=2766702 RepID=UPI0016520E42|nr:cysteine synthase A [Treponema sp. Marseille-Q4130]
MTEKIPTKITDCIGHTPLIEIKNTEKRLALHARILAKLECFNPAGSVKDRIAKAMINDGIKTGKIKKNSVIIEPTSGNTGIGLASVCASCGLRVVLTMPETMSVERRNLLKAYGAEIVLTDGSQGMKGAVEKANEIAKNTPHSFIPSQFTNPVNSETHFKTTGPEIWEACSGHVDAFVAGVGTGGTLSGIGKFLRTKNKNVKIFAVEPASSPLLSEGYAGPHKIQGIGANFIPATLDKKIYNEVIAVKSEDAFSAAKDFAKTEGILAGISSGAALWAAYEVAKRAEFKDKTIVVLLPDSADRYLSTPLFTD